MKFFPRSHDRGRIEAARYRPAKPMSVTFHGHMTVAALKRVVEEIGGYGAGFFPRSHDRGRIEARMPSV